uniref:Uncharacterized protein n=1 Tax=Arundo donax TaxID=35708 RepID=A0A0A9EPD8_ARUDO
MNSLVICHGENAERKKSYQKGSSAKA